MANEEAVKKVMQVAEGLRARLSEPMRGYATQYKGKPVTEAEARAKFRERYGHEPEKCIRAGPIWLAGPVEDGHES